MANDAASFDDDFIDDDEFNDDEDEEDEEDEDEEDEDEEDEDEEDEDEEDDISIIRDDDYLGQATGFPSPGYEPLTPRT